MKKYLSVFMLMLRNSIYRLVLVMLGTVIAFAALLLALGAPGAGGLEEAVANSHIDLAAAAAFILWTAQLCLSCCDLGAKSSYTLSRLRISEKSVFWVKAAHDFLSYILLWAFLTTLCFGLCLLYSVAVKPLGSQEIMLCFYRDELFHALLPLRDGNGWVKLAATLIALALCSAASPMSKTNRVNIIPSAICAAIQLFMFKGAMGSLDTEVIFSIVCLGVAAFAMIDALGKEEDGNEKA